MAFVAKTQLTAGSGATIDEAALVSKFAQAVGAAEKDVSLTVTGDKLTFEVVTMSAIGKESFEAAMTAWSEDGDLAGEALEIPVDGVELQETETRMQPSPPPSLWNPPSAPPKADAAIGAIIGGVVGGIVVVILGVFGAMYCMKKKKEKQLGKGAAKGDAPPPTASV